MQLSQVRSHFEQVCQKSYSFLIMIIANICLGDNDFEQLGFTLAPRIDFAPMIHIHLNTIHTRSYHFSPLVTKTTPSAPRHVNKLSQISSWIVSAQLCSGLSLNCLLIKLSWSQSLFSILKKRSSSRALWLGSFIIELGNGKLSWA